MYQNPFAYDLALLFNMSTDFIKIAKGGLISEGFSLRLQHPLEDAKSLSWVREYYPPKEREDAQNYFEDWSQSEKLSDIKPSLYIE